MTARRHLHYTIEQTVCQTDTSRHAYCSIQRDDAPVATGWALPTLILANPASPIGAQVHSSVSYYGKSFYTESGSGAITDQRSPRKKWRRSEAKSSGSSAAAKCPPRGISVQRSTL